jgi:hypothetical protein
MQVSTVSSLTAAVVRLVEPFLELPQVVVGGGAHVPGFGSLRCDAERVGLLPDAFLAAELLYALDRCDQGLDRGDGMLVGGLEPFRVAGRRRGSLSVGDLRLRSLLVRGGL